MNLANLTKRIKGLLSYLFFQIPFSTKLWRFFFLKKYNKEKILKKITKLINSPGYIYSVAIMLRLDIFLDPAEAADINWREKLSFQEFLFIIGILVKNPINFDLPSIKASEKQIKDTYKLIKNLQTAYNAPIFDKIGESMKKKIKPEELDEEYKRIFGSGEVITESIFYDGSGAYDFQYLEYAIKRYKGDSDWILKNKGLSVKEMVSFAQSLKEIGEEKLRNFKPSNNYRELSEQLIDLFCFSKDDLVKFESDKIVSFLKTFVTVPGEVNDKYFYPGEYNAAESHPIVRLKKNKYFIPIYFALTQSIYESPFYWMTQDDNYINTALSNRGKSVEEIVYEMFVEKFGKKNIYCNIEIWKNKREKITDIDTLMVIGNKALVFQIKSKRLTELSKIGDQQKLSEDFKKAIQDAYDQGLKCREAILEKKNSLKDKLGNIIHLYEAIDEVFIICVTSDNYPAVTNQVDVFLHKRNKDPFPIALNLFDLEIVLFYLIDPFDLLYYVRQRVINYKYFRASSEICYLAYHLNTKLFPFPDKDGVYLDFAWAQLIDANFPALRGRHPITEATEKLHHKWSNEKFQEMIEQMKATATPGFTDAIMFLYDLAGKGADQLIYQIIQIKKKALEDKQRHDFSIILDDGKAGVTFISHPDDLDKLERILYILSVCRKYKTQANFWLGIGSLARSRNLIDVAFFNKSPWKYDKEIEEACNEVITGGKELDLREITKDDSLCPCGSGESYKKCCGK